MITPEQAVAAARALPPQLSKFVTLEKSEDFFEAERREFIEAEWILYEQLFDAWLAKLEQVIGAPSFVGGPSDTGYPEELEGWKVATWRAQAPPLYLSVWHPDQELPIFVCLGRLPAQE